MFLKDLFIHSTLSQALSEAPGMQVPILPKTLASCSWNGTGEALIPMGYERNIPVNSM